MTVQLWMYTHHSQVQSSNNSAVQLAPPPIGTPTITFTSSARGLSGSAVFVPDSSYQLTDTVENDVFTFTVTVTNAAGSSSEMSAAVEGKLFISSFAVMKTSLMPILHTSTVLLYSYPVHR